jgi:hypothetical protein
VKFILQVFHLFLQFFFLFFFTLTWCKNGLIRSQGHVVFTTTYNTAYLIHQSSCTYTHIGDKEMYVFIIVLFFCLLFNALDMNMIYKFIFRSLHIYCFKYKTDNGMLRIDILRRSASVTITSWRLFDDGTIKRSCSDKLDDKFELVTLEDNSPLLLIVVVCEG